MAENKQDPQFLGGGPKFNRAGVGAPEAEAPPPPPATQAIRARTLLIAAVLVALVVLLYYVTSRPNGMVHRGGSGGVSPTQHTAGPENGQNP